MKQFIIVILLTQSIFFHIRGQGSVDIKELISGADLVYDKPVTRSEEGMPVGNGRMGTLVWTTPSSLKFQVNRVDIFGNGSASNSFFERNTDYCSGAAFIDINFVNWGDDVFTGPEFRQHLSCYEGVVTTDGNKIRTTTLVRNKNDVMAVRIEDIREIPQAIVINLRMLRDTLVRKGNHTARSDLKTDGNEIVLVQSFTEGNFYSGSAVAVGAPGRECKIRRPDNRELQLILAPGNKPFTVYISSSASFDKDTDVQKMALSWLHDAERSSFDGIVEENREWWRSFWERSYVHLHSTDGEADFVEKNYNYFMYVMASSSRGMFPPKFNGMIWTTEGDLRKWGNNYWGANQSCMYNGLFPANRLDLIEPMFRMYTAMSPSLEIAAIQQWNSKGIYIPETVSFDGLAELPENISLEMRDLYLARKPWNGRSKEFDEYASTKSPFLSRWNWKQDTGWEDGKWTFTDKGSGAFGHVTHIFSRGAKIAYQYWQKYEFTSDTAWLRSTGYPMIKGVAEFYSNFPNMKKEPDGRYHIYYVNDNESVRGGHNTVEEISAMMGIFPAAIRASEILNVDTELRSRWKELLHNLSPLPLNTDYPDTYRQGTPVTFVRSLGPVIQGPGSGRPDQNTMPVWFFDLCNPVGGNSDLVRIAGDTYDSYFREGINKDSRVYVLSKLAVTGTIMGRKDATRFLIPNQIRTAEIETMPNRMTLREGYQTTGIQNLGRVADALHYALMNSSPPGPGEDPVIKLFHAWPEEWDADFKLLARGNFLVTSSSRGGRVTFLQLVSGSGSICRIINPWPGSKVAVFRNGRKSGTLQGNLLIFKTNKGETIGLDTLKQ